MHIMRNTISAIAVVALATIGATSTASAATPARSGPAAHAATAVPFGNCVFVPPDPARYTFFKGGISSCGACLDEGQDGEDEGFWENFLCWDPGSNDAWQLWIIDGPS